jgi:REP element-mobilizing transposase RayT
MSTGVFNQLTGYHNRQSTRLRGYDYSQPGSYFVTVCIHDRKQKLFGGVIDGKMNENDVGNAVRQCWNDLASHYPHIRLDEFVIMPNHVHGIIVIRDFAPRESVFRNSVGAGLSRPDISTGNSIGRDDRAPTNANRNANATNHMRDNRAGQNSNGRDNPDESNGRDNPAPTNAASRPITLGNMVAYFKYQSTKQICAIRHNGIEKIWQRNYYDHIIRDVKSHYFIRQYILNNPDNWATDVERHLDKEIEMFDRMGSELEGEENE